MADIHKNFAYSTVATAPSPAASGTSLVVGANQGVLFPDPPFNATVWPTGAQPISTNAEIVRVTAIDADTFTITRAQEGSSARTVVVGDQIAATITKKTLTDAEVPITTFSPYVLASGAASGVQTLASASGQTTTGSLFVFPVTVPQSLQFNQILMLNTLVGVTSANTASNTYSSKFGLYSMNANTLSLISSNSFSIGETLRSDSATWNYPASTATSGYAYANFPAGNLTNRSQRSSYVTGVRVVGLQFGGNMTLTGGVYWLGLLSQRATGSNSQHGMSHAGVYGHVIAPHNQVGTVSGLSPIGLAQTQWSLSNTHVTGWWGRHIIGFVTATSLADQSGTAIPAAISLSALGGIAAASTVTILPTITFVST